MMQKLNEKLYCHPLFQVILFKKFKKFNLLIGSSRYLKEHFDDAIALVHRFKNPAMFITMTATEKWPEVQRELHQNIDGVEFKQDWVDRPDLLARAFRIRVKELLNDIMKRKIFGNAVAYVGVIEYQKRGKPHIHLIVFLSREDKDFFFG